jgi:hypothetical protein
MALIQIESNFNTLAVNHTSNAAGLYQILPASKNGFLKAANRRLGYIEFSNTCRFIPYRSNMIFETVNHYKNPNKDFNKMITLHNPSAGEWYKEKVLKRYNLLKDISASL